MKDHPEWWMSVDHPTDLHLMPWPGTGDKRHVPSIGARRCWCGPERWDKDPRIILHIPSMAVWDRK